MKWWNKTYVAVCTGNIQTIFRWVRNETSLAIFSISLIVWISLFALRVTGVLQPMELLAYDSLFRLRSDSVQETPIVLIKETEADIKRYGYPLPNAIFAESMEKLLAAGARVVVDIFRDLPVAPGSERLNQVLTSHENIIWIFFVGNDTHERINPPAVLKNSEQIGFNDMISDANDVSRRGLLFMGDTNDKEVTYNAFPFLLALNYLAKDNIAAQIDDFGNIRLGDSTFTSTTQYGKLCRC